MKKPIQLVLILIFHLSLVAQSEDTASIAKIRNTRSISLQEISTIDSLHPISKSPLFRSFEGIGIASVKQAYQLNRLAVDSVLAADSLSPNFWRLSLYQTVYLFKQANKSPQMAMSIFLPWFIVVFLIFFLALFVRTFFIHETLMMPEKPENDSISEVDSSSEEEPAANDGEAAE